MVPLFFLFGTRSIRHLSRIFLLNVIFLERNKCPFTPLSNFYQTSGSDCYVSKFRNYALHIVQSKLNLQWLLIWLISNNFVINPLKLTLKNKRFSIKNKRFSIWVHTKISGCSTGRHLGLKNFLGVDTITKLLTNKNNRFTNTNAGSAR